ncbi:protein STRICTOSIDINE SYNTHASE-LIKE 13 isoform X2 [Actinidia eriantha]|uniref:protein STRICTOSIDINE SYNTHASE-LIKE 13 isoform X2 n=1 Tax=Actinidia eriantha TaxID=165200 RepID=UPI002588AFCC|nr:protein STRICTOSIDINE SYNTHASE-LIKE 13 isoform X2 [Actinidia eriantha]
MGFVIMDPFHTSPIGGHEFRPVKHDIAPYKQVMENWPKDNMSRLGLGNLEFVDQVFGPKSLEFDVQGCGPYTGLADGRVVRWMGEDGGWETFALVTKNWSEKLCAKGVDSTTSKQWKVEPRCGRPLGLRFDKKTGDLYIADAYYGLLVVGPEGGIATPLTTHVEGKPIFFANDLDIHNNGSIFFTDTSKRYNRVNHFLIMLEGEATGMILLQEQLMLSLMAWLFLMEYNYLRIKPFFCSLRLQIAGPKRGLVELVANLPGFPDNVRLNEKGEFWVVIDCCRTPAQEVLTHNPWIQSVYFRLPIRMRYLARFMGMRMYTVVSLFNEKGKVLDVLEDKQGKVMKLVSEVTEAKGKLWIGTVAHNHIATLPYPLK